MVGVPHERAVELRLSDPVFLEHHLVVFSQRLVVTVIQSRLMQDSISTMEVIEHVAHLSGGEDTFRSAAGKSQQQAQQDDMEF